jgi:hypothetical protein
MINKLFVVVLFVILIVSLVVSVNAHENDEVLQEKLKIDDQITSNSILYVSIASLIVFFSIILSIFFRNKNDKLKVILFLGIVIPIILVSVYLVGATIYLNNISETGGPVHYHADFEIWKCGEKIDLIDPTGLLNRVGTSVLHEHGDDRFHVEGVVVEGKDVDLHSLINVLGGSLIKDRFSIPTNNGKIEIENGELCDGKEGKLQVFVYQVINPDAKRKSGFKYRQIKLDDFEDYILAPYQNVPPGDCIIIEFDEDKENTEKICETYKIAIEKGDII